jgi:nucleotide-binding universal stress UspA family protein
VLRGQSPLNRNERNRLLVLLSGDNTDSRLLNYVTRIALPKNSEVRLIYVVEVDQELPLDADLPADAMRGERVLKTASEVVKQSLNIRSSMVSSDLLQARLAGPAIVDEAVQDGADAIVMGAIVTKRHGKRVCGDTVDYVMKNAPCEVLILRGTMSDSLVRELEMEIE